MPQNPELNSFLQLASAQREVALVVAKDEGELQQLQQTLLQQGFTKVDRTAELIKRFDQPGKLLFVLNRNLNKSIYDLIAQYPTGQVELFDSGAMRTHVTTPNYAQLTLVTLVTQANLLALESQGFALRQLTGLAYQS